MMNNNFKYLSIPVLVCTFLFGGLWLTTKSVTATADATFIAPPGPICRNGASGTSPNFDLAYAGTGSGGMDLSFSLEFDPNVGTGSRPTSQGYLEVIPTIRFKPKLDANGNRIPTEYWLVTSYRDEITYPASQLNPYFSETEDAPAPYTKGMGPIIRSNLGSIWIVGNEVDREIFQDSLLPETYARAYHDAYAYIKSVDPTAQVAVSGLVNFGPDRKQYLDLVIAHYQQIYGQPMPVDIWTMHVYNIAGRHFGSQTSDAGLSAVALGTDPNLTWQTQLVNLGNGNFSSDNSRCDLNDVVCIKEHDDLALFQQQVVSMRQWMKDHGYQEKPLILTEWGLNLTSDFCDENNNRITAQRAADFLTATVNWMDSYKDNSLGFNLDEGRLIQRWAWFTIHGNITIPEIADISHLVTDYTINYPACGTPTEPSKIQNPGNNNALTVVGQAYKNVVAAQNLSTPPFVDFVVDGVLNSSGVIDSGSGTVTTTIGIKVRNVGNSPTGQDTTVIFRDASDNSVIGTYDIPANFQGCTTAIHYATVEWAQTGAGTNGFTFEIQSSEETGAALNNNVGSGSSFIGEYGVWLPRVFK